jgi:hypothetical protein
MEVNGQLQTPTTVLPGENPGTYLTEGSMGPRTGLEDLATRKISFAYRDSTPGPSRP